MKSLLVLTALVAAAVCSVQGQEGPIWEVCVAGSYASYCKGPAEPATECLCFGANPPVEGECRSDYIFSSNWGIWNVSFCPAQQTCSLFTATNAVCRTLYLCRRTDNMYHTHCLSTDDCVFWIVVEWAIKYTPVIDVDCLGE